MTHQIIQIICYADNKKEARERAEIILNDNIVGDRQPFDYGTFFDEESDISGKSRWGKKNPVMLADSKEGKKLIDMGMRDTKDEFKENLKNIRDIIDSYTDEELFEEEVLTEKSKIIENLEEKKENMGIRYFKYYCNNLGQYTGTDIWLYDNNGEGIRNSKALKNVLNKWGEKNKQKVYLVPIDVHS